MGRQRNENLRNPNITDGTVQRISEAGLCRDGYLRFRGKKRVFLFLQKVFWFSTCLESSHGVLSMIFGILGKFGIGIGDPTNFGRQKFRRNKFENFFVDFFLGKKIDFWSKKKSLKISMKIHFLGGSIGIPIGVSIEIPKKSM